MDIVKSIFPISFGAKDKSALITLIILCVIGYVVGGVLGWLVSKIPVVGWIGGIILGLCGLYITITLILGILVFLGVIGDK